MNSHEAKEILLRHRPGTADERDSEVRAALEQAARDPELAAWLDGHLEFQSKVRQELGNLTPPDGLREQILSEKRSRLRTWPVAGKLVVVGACALIILVAFTVLRPNDTTDDNRLATFRMRMVKTALRGYAMDVATNDVTRIREYLTEQQAHADWQSPGPLGQVPLLGCAVLKWQNQPATMVCYGSSSQPDLWLFVVDASVLPDPPGVAERLVENVNRLLTVSWTRDGRTYVLAGDLEEAELLGLLDERG